MRRLSILFFIAMYVVPAMAHAWWNEDWSFRKKITLNTAETGASIDKPVSEFPVLVRLHTGNFKYFLDAQTDGSDIRFIAGDDQTPLKFHIEKFDPLNEMALIWVKMPQLSVNASDKFVWMYYGNSSAVPGGDASGTFDVNYTAVYHFQEGQSSVRDVTAYGNGAAQVTAEVDPRSLIGAGMQFAQGGTLTLPKAPNLSINPQDGFTLSTWIRSPGIEQDSVIYQLEGETGGLTFGHDESGLYARVTQQEAIVAETRAPALRPDTWQHIAMTVGNGQLGIVVDGEQAGSVEAALPVLTGSARLGATAQGERYLAALLDEVRLSNTLRDVNWLNARQQAEGQTSKLLAYGEDEARESGGGSSYFGVIVRNVTVDGWVVIVILAVMAAISWIVMLLKGLFVQRCHKDNERFLAEFKKLDRANLAFLDAEETEEERELAESPLAAAVFGKHDHFQSSPIYHVYHRGISELETRVGKSAGAQASGVITAQSLEAIRAALDATLVRESQKLNRMMVLLTISISGGPFLGLLGTVVGVMITFAAIAASGDVNINSIAPGVAAALLATVAGLVVAIPALFGYNYLGTRIKDMIADMRVFVDEFVTRVGEYYGADKEKGE